MTDMFKGDDAALIDSINAAIELNRDGAMVPRIPTMAIELLASAAARLATPTDDAALVKPAEKRIAAYLETREFMGVEGTFIDDQACGSSDGDPVAELHTSDLEALLAARGTGQGEAVQHAEDCQSHIVDVRGNPDDCTCGAAERAEVKTNHDCLAKRRPGEPMFILLGRDPDGHNLVRSWAERRRAAGGDPEHCQQGLDTAARMEAYAADPDNRPASAPPAEAYTPLGGWKPTFDELKVAIADGFTNGNEQYDETSQAQRDRFDMAARAILALPAAPSLGEG